MKTPDKRCRKCEYWRALSAGGIEACHYCVDHLEMRKQEGDRCLSFKLNKKRRNE